MAIDTANKRASALGVNNPSARGWRFFPGGSGLATPTGRQQAALAYIGILASAPILAQLVNATWWYLQMALDKYNNGVAIVPSDAASANFPICSGIYVGGAGVVPVVFANGNVVNFTAVAGEILPVGAVRVNAANLTASLLVALYAV